MANWIGIYNFSRRQLLYQSEPHFGLCLHYITSQHQFGPHFRLCLNYMTSKHQFEPHFRPCLNYITSLLIHISHVTFILPFITVLHWSSLIEYFSRAFHCWHLVTTNHHSKSLSYPNLCCGVKGLHHGTRNDTEDRPEEGESCFWGPSLHRNTNGEGGY